VELRHLRYFVAVAEELHFRRAAERLHVSQPPLSQQIRQLEAELGVTLFERNRRRVELTAAGAVLLGEARQVLAAVEHAVDLTRRAARGEAGALAVGFVGSAMYGRLPDVVREFHAARPAVELRLREFSTGDALDALVEGRIDVGVVRPGHAQVDGALDVTVVAREPVVAALPAGHALAGASRVDLADLAGEAFVLLSRREAPGLHGALTDAMAASHVAPAEVQEVSELRTVLGLVSAGVGVSLVPASVAGGERSGVVFRPLRGRAPGVELALAWRRGDGSPALAAFLELARDGLRSDHAPGSP
jgi:DNA-binding transcriptional LysR family regulator